MLPRVVYVFRDDRAMAEAAAELIESFATKAVEERGRFHWALAGGGTPKLTYGVLAGETYRETFPWASSEAWLGDERFVPIDDAASNARMVLEHLIEPAGADPASLHAFDTSLDPEAAASDYARRLAERLPDPPVLDLVLLGLGADTHTASWFPGSEFQDDAWVASTGEQAGHRRLTLTPTVVNAARRVMFLVSGSGKRDAVARVLDGPNDPRDVPAQRVAPSAGQVVWMLDGEAAGHSFGD